MSNVLQRYSENSLQLQRQEPASTGDSFSLLFVCKILQDQGIINRQDLGRIRSQGITLSKHLRQQRKHANDSSPMTPVDVLSTLKLQSRSEPGQLVTEDTIMKALASHWKLPFLKIELSKLNVSKVTPNISEPFARKHLIVPVLSSKSMLLVALVNPLDFEALEMVKRTSKYKVRAVISTKSDILTAIDQCYGHKKAVRADNRLRYDFRQAVEQAKDDLQLDSSAETLDAQLNEHDTNYSEKSIVKALDALLLYAVSHHAGDIHFEPKRNECLIRLRIDGILHELDRIPLSIHQSLVIRLKAMAGMNITEKRKPLDGSFRSTIQKKDIEFRISTMPVLFGEKVMLRLLDGSQLLQPLENLGFSDSGLALYRSLLTHHQGMILITGPAGSGKTTTLYSTLNVLSERAINVTTIEDPIELVHERFNQIAVQPGIGLDFSMALRHIVRQAPDVIMVGEIRDKDTAENAFKAALTGHLVLSTLHTNDAASAVVRLADLGVSASLMESALLAVVSQKLLRTVCPDCAKPHQLSENEQQQLHPDPHELAGSSLRQGSGCSSCLDTGYSGRTAAFELLPLTDTIKTLIHSNSAAHIIKAAAIQEGMRTLHENILEKFYQGLTSSEEVLRITGRSRI